MYEEKREGFERESRENEIDTWKDLYLREKLLEYKYEVRSILDKDEKVENHIIKNKIYKHKF